MALRKERPIIAVLAAAGIAGFAYLGSEADSFFKKHKARIQVEKTTSGDHLYLLGGRPRKGKGSIGIGSEGVNLSRQEEGRFVLSIPTEKK